MEPPRFADDGASQISSWAVASTDVLGYILTWMLVFVVSCTAAMFIYSQVTGEQPEESWTEVALGVTAISAVLYGLVRYRASRIARLLATGHRFRASIDKSFHMGQWVRLELCYENEARLLRRKLLLPSSKRTRSLDEGKEVTVVVHPDSPRRLTIADLYQ